MQKHTEAATPRSTEAVPERLDWDDLRYFLEVARVGRATAAARRLGVDYTTVARRIRALEAALGTLLFDKSRADGFVLTGEGQRLMAYADAIESTVGSAYERLANSGQALSGQLRVAATEGFGASFLAPRLARFQANHPLINVELIAVPHFVSLSKREADLAVTIERPARGPYICTKLTDYRLKLYATPAYLQRHAPIRGVADLAGHRFVSYVEGLAFSQELLYLEHAVPGAQVVWRSTSVIAQHQAVRSGEAMGILPCFLARDDPALQVVLPDALSVTRTFWLYCVEEQRRLRRMSELWGFLRAEADAARALLLDEPTTG
ncbi:LysR family transcriptional regulator [Chitinasiproducens palmae]|uniref:DNA-binding transcriptional regulator, LysR family n=1 Tax=Chitinasiproducens palmae TaxID=1770053 RepID=A0A1H2PJR7_9BURK|nr:LysR family transcriptional regulator [Chitinasiproducens palmae]SDV46615.1 DNA-binding transcriptional regulator, LysR family [Chitinasiproducens palmae]